MIILPTHKINNLTEDIIRFRFNRIQLRFEPHESIEVSITHNKDPMKRALVFIEKDFRGRLEVINLQKLELLKIIEKSDKTEKKEKSDVKEE